jgi:glyoxylase-like metal-dependent hydrolase (beta-lactamase superfamily II)
MDGVAPSKLGTQPVRKAAEVTEGVYQLKVPVPIPLVFVSAYLVEGEDGWTIIDTGFDYPRGGRRGRPGRGRSGVIFAGTYRASS